MAGIIGQVAAIINERELVINRGAEQGVKFDMLFSVMDREVPVIDPETKENLGTVRREKVKVKVTRVEPKYAVARTFETYRVNEGGNWNMGLEMLRPPKIVTKVRTLRFDETGLDYAPLAPSESLVKIGDPVEEIEITSAEDAKKVEPKK